MRVYADIAIIVKKPSAVGNRHHNAGWVTQLLAVPCITCAMAGGTCKCVRDLLTWSHSWQV